MFNECQQHDEFVSLPIEQQWNILAKYDYEFYVEYVHRGLYRHGRHTKYICKLLEQVERGELRRLILCLPPRHSKSMTVSETFPSWFIGRDPERRVIEVSYGDRLARRFGRLNKQKVVEFGRRIFNIALPAWGVGISSSNDWGIASIASNGKTLINRRGGMLSVGIGGSITGEGADLLLIDDPIKNREEAYSEVYRNKVWEEWKNTLRTRLQPEGRVIIIVTRWHEDDLVGRLLNKKYKELDGETDEWTVVSLPAVCDSEDDLLNRKIGETLWPEFGFDEEWAEKTRIDVGSVTWSALYQQKPMPTEGNIIKREWWKTYNPLAMPKMEFVVQSWDCAFEETGKGSYTVCTTWGRSEGKYYLIDVFRKRIEFPELIRMMKALYAKYNPHAVLVEYAASGKSAFQSLKSQTELPLIPITPTKSKIVRLEIVSAVIEAGKVYLPEYASWLFDYIDEISKFPGGEHDDQVDSTSQALSYLQERTARWIVTSDEFEVEKKKGIYTFSEDDDEDNGKLTDNGFEISIADVSEMTKEQILRERYGV